MPDEKGCYPTAVAAAFTALGETYTPQKIDQAIGRAPGELPTHDEYFGFDQWIMQRRHLEEISSQDVPNLAAFYRANSHETYESCVAYLREWGYGDSYFATQFTEADFDAACRRYQHLEPVYDKQRKAGNFIRNRLAVTADLLETRLSQNKAILGTVAWDSGENHAVAILRPDDMDAGSGLLFYPYCERPADVETLPLDDIVRNEITSAFGLRIIG